MTGNPNRTFSDPSKIPAKLRALFTPEKIAQWNKNQPIRDKWLADHPVMAGIYKKWAPLRDELLNPSTSNAAATSAPTPDVKPGSTTRPTPTGAWSGRSLPTNPSSTSNPLTIKGQRPTNRPFNTRY